jgi:hypothetical protein
VDTNVTMKNDTTLKQPTQVTHTTAATNDTGRVGDSFSKRFTTELKFTGSATSDLEVAIRIFKNCANDNNMSVDDAIRFTHNMFTGAASIFHQTWIDNHPSGSFTEMIAAVSDRFILHANRSVMTRKLESLSIAKLMSSKKIDATAALTDLYNTITTTAPLAESIAVGSCAAEASEQNV